MKLNVMFSENQMSVSTDFGETQIAKSQAKEVTPASTQQIVLPDNGYEYLTRVVVSPIPHLESLTVTPEMLAEGVVAIGADGKLIVGTAKVVTLCVLGESKIGLVII